MRLRRTSTVAGGTRLATSRVMRWYDLRLAAIAGLAYVGAAADDALDDLAVDRQGDEVGSARRCWNRHRGRRPCSTSFLTGFRLHESSTASRRGLAATAYRFKSLEFDHGDPTDWPGERHTSRWYAYVRGRRASRNASLKRLRLRLSVYRLRLRRTPIVWVFDSAALEFLTRECYAGSV